MRENGGLLEIFLDGCGFVGEILGWMWICWRGWRMKESLLEKCKKNEGLLEKCKNDNEGLLEKL